MAEYRMGRGHLMVRVSMKTGRSFTELQRMPAEKLQTDIDDALIDITAERHFDRDTVAWLADLAGGEILATMQDLEASEA